MSVATVHMGRMVGGTVRHGRGRRSGARPVRREVRATWSWIAPLAWAVALGCLIAAIGVLPSARDLAPARTSAAISVTVANADTLWSIAASHPVPGMSTAQTVEAIREANGLTTGRLAAGQVLDVPAEGVGGTAFAQVKAPNAAH
jgi:hypothetical protein